MKSPTFYIHLNLTLCNFMFLQNGNNISISNLIIKVELSAVVFSVDFAIVAFLLMYLIPMNSGYHLPLVTRMSDFSSLS